MEDQTARFELTTSLSINGTVDSLDLYTERLDTALAQVLGGSPLVTAYFVRANHEAVEIEVGLRFEGMKAEKVEDAADHLIDQAIDKATRSFKEGSGKTGLTAVREESTLVPA